MTECELENRLLEASPSPVMSQQQHPAVAREKLTSTCDLKSFSSITRALAALFNAFFASSPMRFSLAASSSWQSVSS